MQNLLRSRKFWLAVLDAFVSTLSLVLAWYFSPDKVQQVMALVGLWQPVIIAVIIGITVEDAAAKYSGTFVPPAEKPGARG